MVSRGCFVVLEGLDKSGKTTQVGRLKEILSREDPDKYVFINFPDRTTAIGKQINDYLSNQSEISDLDVKAWELHVLFSENRREFESKIIQTLKQGKTIVCDRYAHSGVAYSSAKGLDIERCLSSDRGLPSPDLVVYLDIAPEVAQTRGNYGEERYEKLEFQQKVADAFLVMMQKQVQTQSPEWYILNATRNPLDLTRDIVSKIKEIEQKVSGTEIQHLW